MFQRLKARFAWAKLTPQHTDYQMFETVFYSKISYEIYLLISLQSMR